MPNRHSLRRRIWSTLLKRSQSKADEQRAQAQAQRDAAAKAAAPREVVHAVLPGSIVWSAEATVPAVSRLGQSLALSVMKESAPFHLSTEVSRLEVNQGRQILLPLKLARRNGFDADVAMTLAGLAPGNLNIQNTPFPKGKSEELLRLFVAKGTRPGTYAVYWNLQAPVSYRRNPFAFERAEREQSAAAKADADAAAQAKSLTAARDRAIKKQSECAAAIKPLQTQLTKLEQSLASAQRALAATAENRTTAQKLAQRRPRQKAETAGRDRSCRSPSSPANRPTKRRPTRNRLRSRRSPSCRPVRRKPGALADELRKNADEASAKAGIPRHVVATVDPKHAESPTQRQETRRRGGNDQEKAGDRGGGTQCGERIQAASRIARDGGGGKIQATGGGPHKAADARVAEAKKVAAPQNLTDFAPSTPILLTVKNAPIEVSASVPKGGQLKRGARLDVKVKVRRSTEASKDR